MATRSVRLTAHGGHLRPTGDLAGAYIAVRCRETAATTREGANLICGAGPCPGVLFQETWDSVTSV